MGERCHRVPGDAAGLTIASMKRFNQQHCPAVCSAAAGPVLKASDALAAPVSCCALPLHPTQLRPEHACPTYPLLAPIPSAPCQPALAAKALSCPCPAMGDAAGHGALGTSTAQPCLRRVRGSNWDFFFGISQWLGCFFLFVCFKSVLILVCP